MIEIIGSQIHVNGVVQGVGFRPFIYGLATRLSLYGWVKNTSAGVDIHIEGAPDNVASFLDGLHNDSPPLARIDKISVNESSSNGYLSFEIIPSESQTNAFQPISPDVSICQDCYQELLNPNDRRYLYPFINCTNCGPRFTIIEDIPYDRPNTTMSGFEMCPDCLEEYTNPLDRRFHAQPIACPICGPRVWLEINNIPEIDKDNRDNPDSINAIKTARNLLQRGKIVAIKGLGGFHLACDARNPEAVERLRSRKLRVDKPFAIMFPDVDTINKHCHIDDHERALLNSTERPIVVVQRKETSDICSAVAPKQNTLGVMLPYTPLHYLLFIKNNELISDDHSTDDNLLSVLVMTSGNISEEPIAIENSEARSRLADIADAFLMHNRPIYIRCDDSVMRILEKPQDSVINYSLESVNHDDKSSDSTLSNNFQSDIYPLRRSRGYAPYPIYLPKPMPTILAVGAELKNTFCVTHDCYAFISQHIGDLENYETLVSFEKGITHYERLFQIRPELIAFDLHPNYLSTRYAADRAERESIPCIGIQHHHAHIAACMIENDIQEDELVIGVAFDGTGFGTDGKIWGGEFLLSNYSSFSRVAHLDYLPLPGGDTSIRKPARIALAYLWSVGIDWDPALDCVSSLCVEERQAIGSQLENKLNSPFTSSMGRLFDAVAALVGVRQRINYEAQAAIELEHIVAKNETSFYEFTIQNSSGNDNAMIINPKNVIHSIVNDVYNDVSSQLIAARFHNGVSQMVMKVCKEIQNRFNTNKIVLSGGVWQNTTLLLNTIHLLSKNGFLTYIHRQVPPNDGGISLGQAVIAAAQADGRIE